MHEKALTKADRELQYHTLTGDDRHHRVCPENRKREEENRETGDMHII